MPKSLFPLNSEFEDDEFDDPDSKFSEIPYSSEIPEPFTDVYRIPPFHIQFVEYLTCREKASAFGFAGFGMAWILLGTVMAEIRYGSAVTRWRQLWCCVEAGVLGCGVVLSSLMMFDLNCSPYFTGRRRNLFYEETLRHSLNSKFKIYENIDRIMMSKERISKLDFYEAFNEVNEENKPQH